MSHPIHLARCRNELTPRREPYWGAPLDSGRHLGIRKLEDGTATWIAKLRDDDGKKHYRSLGRLTPTFEFSEAKHKAEKWFADFSVGVVDEAATVASVCKEYVAELQASGRGAVATGDRRKDPAAVPGWGAAHDAHMRFKRFVYDAPLGKVLLSRLTSPVKLREWRNELPGSKDSQNRNWEALRAALYLAITNRRVNPSLMQILREVKKHKNAKRRRGLFLDIKQRRAFLKAGEGAVKNLIEAAMHTGARPGELASAKRSQFDARTQAMRFTGKTGTRDVPLSPAAVKFFTQIAKGKLPTAPLLPGDDGKPWPHSGWDEGVRAAAKKAELPAGVVLTTLRHSWITEALLGGMSTLSVARLTGTSLEMIEKHYGHLAVDTARERLAAVTML